MIDQDRLIELREERKMLIHDVSKILNIEKDTYGKYERGYITIPIKHLNTISNYFQVSIDYIFHFTNIKQYPNSIETIDLKKTSSRLKEFRKENHLSQVELANILNVVKGTIGNYESARSLIATPFLYTICKKYKVSADYLLGKIDTPKYLK